MKKFILILVIAGIVISVFTNPQFFKSLFNLEEVEINTLKTDTKKDSDNKDISLKEETKNAQKRQTATLSQDISSDSLPVSIEEARLNKKEASESISIIDNDWQLYKNNKLKMQIKAPREMSEIKCAKDRTEVKLPVKIFSDNTAIYLVPEFSYNWQSCEKEDASLEKLQGSNLFAWTIRPKANIDESSIGAYLKEKFGAGCTIKNSEKQGDTLRYYLNPTGFDVPEAERCSVNYKYAIFYSPSTKRIVSWKMGQDYNFRRGEKTYDDDILASFEFLK